MDHNKVRTRAVLQVEFVKGKDLFNFVIASDKPDSKLAAYFIKEISEAINHFHNNVQFAHRDLKLDNIMMMSDFSIKIIDFGFGTKIRDEKDQPIYSNEIFGTPGYQAPEIDSGKY